MPRWIDELNEWIGRGVAWLTLAMVLLMLGIVIARYAFSIGSIAMQEAVLYMHAAVFLLGAGYALRNDEHVRVDIFYRRWSPRRQALIDLSGTIILLLPLCIFLIDASFDYVRSAWRVKEGSREAGGLPAVFLLKTLIPVSAALIGIQGLLNAMRCAQRLGWIGKS